MKNRIMCLAMIALMVIGTPLTAYAEDLKGAQNWAVNFDGKKLDSNFKGDEMSDDILKNIQPDDSVTIQIELKNTSDKSSDWYMANEVIKTLEDSSAAANGGAYTYILTYHAPDGGKTVLYSNDEVGGESKSGNDAGLHEVSDNLKNFFYLDRIKAGKSGKITLYVQLDGETQGNAYQKTLAQIQMDFAVEAVNSATIEKHIVEKETKEVVNYVTTTDKVSVATSDNSEPVLFSTLTLVSGMALLSIALVTMKKKHQQKGV